MNGYPDEVALEMIITTINQPSPSQPQDRAVWLRILLDDRIPLPYVGANAIPLIGLLTDAELTTIARACDILARLPDTTLMTVRDDPPRLTEDRQRRSWSRRLLTRLSGFGEAGAERLRFLIGDARLVDVDQDYEVWQHPFLAGLIGLCQMGPAAASQRGAVDALIDARIVEIGETNYGRLTVNMPVARGFAHSEVAEANAWSPKPFEAARLGSEIARALRKPDCTC